MTRIKKIYISGKIINDKSLLVIGITKKLSCIPIVTLVQASLLSFFHDEPSGTLRRNENCLRSCKSVEIRVVYDQAADVLPR